MITLIEKPITAELEINPQDTLVSLLRCRAETQPDKLAYGFLDQGEVLSAQLTYSELHQRALTIAKHLHNILQEGDQTQPHVMLLYPSGVEFIEAFFGCLYAGAIAIPASLPHPPYISRALRRLQAIVEGSDATVVLTTHSERDTLLEQIDSLDGLETLKQMVWVASDKVADLDSDETDYWHEPSLTSSDIAYLQYTSGSTGVPNGVIVTHENLLYNLAMFKVEDPIEDGTMVNWLPIFHDLGLIFGLLYPLYRGYDCYLMSPESFIRKPVRWLNAISQYRGTHSAAPNFAYHICARKSTFEERQKLDLSSWQFALNGAEPVRVDTLLRFQDQFSSCGFRLDYFVPAYGLAEATLMVSTGTQNKRPYIIHLDKQAMGNNRVQLGELNDSNTQSFVSCGTPLFGDEVRIVDPDTFEACSVDQIGEIWLSGKHITQGYWNNSTKTDETFRVSISGEDSNRQYLRTGDLGFIYDGELFITGRIKDILIIRGRNHYPHDIEATVQQVNEVYRDGCGAAFSIDGDENNDNEERLIVVQEVRKEITEFSAANLNKLWNQTRSAVASEHYVSLHGLCLIPSHKIMKTSSGKIQRNYTKVCYLGDRLNIIKLWDSSTSTEGDLVMRNNDIALDTEEMKAWLVKNVAEILRISDDDVDTGAHLEELGMDSQESFELVGMLEQDFLESRYQLPQNMVQADGSINVMVESIAKLVAEQD